MLDAHQVSEVLDGIGLGKEEVDEVAKGGAACVGGARLSLVVPVGLVVEAVGAADLDEGGARLGVVGKKVEGEEAVGRVGGGAGAGGNEGVGGEAGGGGVAVLDVEAGVGEGGGAEVDMELVAAGGGLNAGRQEAVLADSEIVVAAGGGEEAGEAAGDDAADDGMAGERAGGGGEGGGGGEALSGFVGLDFAVQRFSGEEGAVGGGGAGVEDAL